MSQISSEAQEASDSSNNRPPVVEPSKPISAPPVEKACRLGSSTGCEYTRITCNGSGGVENMNLTIGSTLGRGSFAEVKGAYCPSRKRLMALKIVNKKAASEEYLSTCLPREIELLRSLVAHPCIIATHSIVETEQKAFILMDLAGNGDLLDYIGFRKRLSEPEARYLFSQVAEGVQFLHSNSIAHRDLKCDNILLDHDMNIKIADFGFAIDVSSYCVSTACGSYAYAAPELFTRSTLGYDALKTDVWSLGVILFAMVSGGLLFGDDDTAMRTQNSRRVHFSPSLTLTEPFKDLILHVLQKDPSHRLSSDQMAQHVWMIQGSAVKPAQPRKFSAKYTKINLGIRPSNHDHLTSDIGISSSGSSERYLAPSSTPHPHQHRPSRFLRNIFSKISSAIKPRRT